MVKVVWSSNPLSTDPADVPHLRGAAGAVRKPGDRIAVRKRLTAARNVLSDVRGLGWHGLTTSWEATVGKLEAELAVIDGA